MTEIDWKRVRPLLRELVELPAGEHEGYLARVCGDDTELASTLRRLYAEDQDDASLLDGPFAAAPPADTTLRPGDLVGPWRVERPLGVGGMGEVWLAERADIGQRAAIKVVRQGLLTRDIAARFERERRLLAGLEHPNVARLVDGGTLPDGRPWFAMEYVEGARIDAFCAAGRLDVRERIELFMQVLEAVEAAHRQLIVHRDLKPSNVLVQADGTPKLLDFGIAKALESEDNATQTSPELRAMTPRYASPEQVEGRPVSTQSDVYSLGVLLYELLTTASPYGARTSSVALWRAVSENDPTRPSQAVRELDAGALEAFGRDGAVPRLRRRLSRELDWIVMTALRKEPERRYASVQRFADDLAGFLAGRPVGAGPDSWRYRAGKVVSRNLPAVAGGSLAVLALVGGTFAALRSAREARVALDAASDTIFFLEHFVLAGTPDRGTGRGTLMVDALRSARGSIESIESPYARWAAHALLGSAFNELGESDAAIEHFETSIELARSLGEGGLAVAHLHHELGLALARVGRDREAAPLLRRGLALLEESDHSRLDRVMRTANADLTLPLLLNTLAMALDGMGEIEEALELHQRAAASLDQRGGDTPTGLILRFNIACSHLAAGRIDQAVSETEAVYRDLSRADWAPTSSRVGIEAGLAHMLCLTGRSEEAEPLVRGAVERARQEFSPEHPRTWDAELGLARALAANRRFDECEELALSLRSRPGADGAEQELELESILARCWIHAGRAETAAAVLEQALRRAETELVDMHAEQGFLRLAHVECLAALGHDEEAASELGVAIELFEAFGGPGNAFVRQAEALGEELGVR